MRVAVPKQKVKYDAPQQTRKLLRRVRLTQA